MSIQSHILGFPRVGLERELKKALESYSQVNDKKLGFQKYHNI